MQAFVEAEAQQFQRRNAALPPSWRGRL